MVSVCVFLREKRSLGGRSLQVAGHTGTLGWKWTKAPCQDLFGAPLLLMPPMRGRKSTNCNRQKIWSKAAHRKPQISTSFDNCHLAPLGLQMIAEMAP